MEDKLKLNLSDGIGISISSTNGLPLMLGILFQEENSQTNSILIEAPKNFKHFLQNCEQLSASQDCQNSHELLTY